MSPIRRAPVRLAAGLALVSLLTISIPSAAAGAPRSSEPTWPTGRSETSSRLLVRFAEGVGSSRRSAVATEHGLRRVDRIAGTGIDVLAVPDGRAGSLAKTLRASPDVVEVATDDPLTLLADPTSEPGWGSQWGMHNTGQNINGYDGVADTDVDGLEALGVATGDPSVVVAVIDNGVDFSHPDLAGQAWTNPNEIANGADDDGNGIIDDVHGVNYCTSPASGVTYQTGEWHGTHVAGTIAASLDGEGVVGVAPDVRIMALRFICGQSGSTSNAVKAIEYAKAHGVRIANNSWGGSAYNSVLASTIANSGMLFVAAAGNGGLDSRGDNNDTSPTYPASYTAANVLSVAAIHNEGGLSSFSNYGKTSVDISAPGEDIVSTIPGDVDADCPSPCYGWASGTSMAAPHVTGVAALAASVAPSLLSNPTALKARILATGSYLPATAGKTVTGRLVNAYRALDTTNPVAAAPAGFAFVTGVSVGSSIRTRVRWPAGTDDLSGIARYTLGQSVNGAGYTTITSSATGLYVDRPLTFEATYGFRLRATDKAGNAGAYATGPQVKARLHQQTSSTVTYGGTWTTATSSSASGRSTRYATKAGAWVQFTFSGRAMAVVAPRSPTRGNAKVYVDGAYVGTISAYRSSGQSRIVLFARSWPVSGNHTVRLVVSGTSGRPRFDIDAFARLY